MDEEINKLKYNIPIKQEVKKIEHKLNYDQYNSIEEFKSDVDLMCNNCKNSTCLKI